MIEGYKETQLGLIPSSWKLMSLEEINIPNSSISYGVVQPGPEDFNGIQFIRGGDIKEGKISKDLRTISKAVSDSYSRTLLKGGEILISLVGYPGECAVVPKSLKGANIARQVGIIRLTENNDKFYIRQYLSSPIGKKNLLGNLVGSAQQVINLNMLRKVQIPIPPLLEQQKIAEILNTADDKIEVIDQQIIATQELKKGLMQRLLTKGIGHTEFKESPLGMIPVSWEAVNIGDVLKLGSGKDYKHLCIGTIPVYGTGGIITYVDSYLYDGESVGIGRKGTIDKPVLLKDKFWTVDTLFYTHSFNNITPFYVYIVFQSIKWRGYSEATGVPSLSKNIIEPIKIPLPPMEEQMKISNIFSSIDDKLEVLSEKKTHYKELKQGLMQQLLTGKIRVIV